MAGVSTWPTEKIADLCLTFSGGTPSTSRPEYYGGDIPWIASADLNHRRIRSVFGRITRLGLERSSAKMVKAGTPLLALYGATAGVAAITYVNGAINQAILAMVPKGIDGEFLYQWLSANRTAIIDRYTQGGQPNLSGAIVRRIEMPVPPLSEQRAIVSALNDVDGVVEALERLITKKQAIKYGMMQQLFTGKTRLPGFTDEWTEVKLEDIATVNMGQSPIGSSYNASGRGLPLVQGNADIRDRRTIDRIWTTRPTKRCRAGDVVLTVRAPVGFTAVASKDACVGRGVCSINAPGDNRFLYQALVYSEPAWSVYEQGSTFTAVNSNEVRSFVLPWPNDQAERSAIATVLDDADRNLAMLAARLAKAKAVKQGMTQELLTGRTRLRSKEPAV